MDLTKLTDEGLAGYIQENSGQGFEYIIDRYERALLRYAKRLTGDMHLSEDIVQEVFLSVYQNINSFDITRKFSSWIYRITHNKSINVLKKKSLVLSLGDKDIVDRKDILSEFEKKLDLKKTKESLEKAINVLPIKYREVIILRYFEDKSYEEISDICHCPVSTVGVRIKRALKILKDKIQIKNIKDYL